ncbi:hypothetical protein C8A05DRAFT_37061 [Staphylotrichum tortipilum]|uniref:Uncharacterized protein n=1 Tax=Staphylotrichum tortipilum TaxID=2831512 RepID=A0AAN6MEI6_9PEZI|nr:hypothetical protein C8A05DRAFT_37061 [Staphylotrichum longicolle]
MAITPILYQDLKIAGNRSAIRAAISRSRHQLWRERAIYGKPDFTVFPGLEELPLEYSRVASPLRLRSQHLGTSVLPFMSRRLQQLSDLAILQDVYIDNRGLFNNIVGGEHLHFNPNASDIDEESDDDGDPYVLLALDSLIGDNPVTEGLAVHLTKNPEAALGSHLIGALAHMVSRFRHLSQLAIQENVARKRLLETKTLVKVARMLAAVVPQLQYKVYDMHWRI